MRPTELSSAAATHLRSEEGEEGPKENHEEDHGSWDKEEMMGSRQTLPLAASFGANLRVVRRARGLSQRALAQRMKGALTTSYVVRLEQGRAPLPNQVGIEALARALEVPPLALLEDDRVATVYRAEQQLAAIERQLLGRPEADQSERSRLLKEIRALREHEDDSSMQGRP